MLAAMTARSLGHRAPLLWVVLPLIAGLVLGRLNPGIGIGLLLATAATGAIAAVIASWCERWSWAWPIAMTVALVGAGAASYELQRRRLAAWEMLPPREVTASLRVDRLFSPADPRKSSGIGQITATDDPTTTELVGQRIYFSAFVRDRDRLPTRSAVVRVTGVLASLPSDPPPNSFDGYLAASGINFRVTRARVVRIERPQRAYYRFCDAAAARFNAILGLGIEEKRPTLAGLLRAMMLGETRALTDEQHTMFMQSGTMHLFAISGLNIAVIAGAIEALLRLGRLGPLTRFAVGTPLLWLFVDITGAAPSAVRAFAMAMFFKAATVARRPANPLAALVGSAALVLVLQPLQLFSASFLMSYAIVIALLVLGLPLTDAWLAHTALWRDVPRVTWSRWQRWSDSLWRAIVPALAIGLATTLVSLLTSVQFFQLLTPGAFVENLVLIPTAMLVTLGGFAALVCGLIGFTAGAVLCNHASALVLLVIERFVRASVHVPGAFLAAEFRAPWIGGLALAALIAVLLYGYATAWTWRRGGWWPPFAIVALTLAFGVRFGLPPAAPGQTARPPYSDHTRSAVRAAAPQSMSANARKPARIADD
jgi:competence protein ComEC